MTPTPIRSVRISDELWAAATAKAIAEGTTASAVIVQALQDFTK